VTNSEVSGRFTRPAPDAVSGAEAAAAADSGSVIPTFSALLDPITSCRFIKETYGRLPRNFPGHSGRFDEVLTWAALNELLRDQRFGERLRLSRDGRELASDLYSTNIETPLGTLRRLDVAALYRHLRGDATLVIDAIDQAHAPVRQVKQSLERELGVYVSVNLYASWGHTHGFDVHWDDHDVFVLQITGRKRWQIFEPTRRWPLKWDIESAPKPVDDAVSDFELTEGDVLYLPRGWWHDVTAVGEPSVHLTFSVIRPSGVNFLDWIGRKARTNEAVRCDVPMKASEGEQEQYVERIREGVDRLLSANSLQDYLEELRDNFYLDPKPTLQAVGTPNPATWDPDTRMRLLSTQAKITCLEAEPPVLRVSGRDWELPSDAESVVALLAGGDELLMGVLCASLGARLVRDLIFEGVLGEA
jgi:hypothetical protein